MRLLEIIATPESDPDAIAAISDFCDKRLGKAIVVAKDTPNFIANRIGTFSVLNVMRVMQEMDIAVAGDFLVMAATLIELKTRMLLPRDPLADFVRLKPRSGPSLDFDPSSHGCSPGWGQPRSDGRRG